MEQVFLQLLNRGISASYLILAILLARLLLQKAPKNTRYLLWALAGIRLAIPFFPESPLSLIPSAQTLPSEILYSQQPQIDSGVSVIDQVLNPIMAGSLTPSPGASVNPIQVLMILGANFWVLGMAVMTLWALVSYLRLRWKLREAVPLRDPIYLCDQIQSPFLLGFFRPRIYLPAMMEEDTQRYVLAHEQAHLRRLDNVWKILAFGILTVYWFHPLVWVGYWLFCRDMELSCDELVLRQLGEDCKADYAQALLRCSAPRGKFAVCPVAFGEDGVKKRILVILNYKKPALWILIAAIILCAVLAVCFLSDPAAPAQEHTSSLYAIVVEVRSDSLLVAPLEQADARISISANGQDFKNGDVIRVLYSEIQMGSPAILSDAAQIQSLSSLSDAQRLLELQNHHPEFFGLPTQQGLSIYVCAFSPRAYRCALVPADRALSFSQQLELTWVDWEDMALILTLYEDAITPEKIQIVLYQHPLSSYAFINTEIPLHQARILYLLGLSDREAPPVGPDPIPLPIDPAPATVSP